MRRAVLLMGMAAALAVGPSPAAAAETPEKEPSTESSGKVYAWKSKRGLRYEYFVPGNHDAGKGEKKWKLDPGAVKAYRQVAEPYGNSLEGGIEEYTERNREFSD